MTCGMCPFNDGMCYTSNPPKRKCTITDEFHYYDDECNCEYSRLLKEQEQQKVIATLEESTPVLNEFSANKIAASEYEFPDTITEYICEPITTFGTPCLICGETVFVDIYGAGPKVCTSCKEAIQFVKDKLMEKKDE